MNRLSRFITIPNHIVTSSNTGGNTRAQIQRIQQLHAMSFLSCRDFTHTGPRQVHCTHTQQQLVTPPSHNHRLRQEGNTQILHSLETRTRTLDRLPGTSFHQVSMCEMSQKVRKNLIRWIYLSKLVLMRLALPVKWPSMPSAKRPFQKCQPR